jgi:hypothetical protein
VNSDFVNPYESTMVYTPSGVGPENIPEAQMFDQFQ